MQVQVSGKHVDVGEALRMRVTDEIITSIGKYFERGGDADVTVDTGFPIAPGAAMTIEHSGPIYAIADADDQDVRIYEEA